MSIQSYNSPIDVQWNIDSQGNKITVPISDEQHMVAQGYFTLNQIPDYIDKVIINGMYEIDYGIPDETQFKVNYEMGTVFFHESHEGKMITINSYSGRGLWRISAKRIYDDETNLLIDTDKSLQGFMDSLKNIQSEFDKFQSQGNYSPTITYSKYNIVIYNNDTYMSLQDNNLNHQPDTSSGYWNLIAKSGDKGSSIHLRGTYSPIIQYKQLDIVKYQNNLYIAKQDNMNIIPVDGLIWELILTNNDDYINTAYYYDSGIEINHGLNTYPDILAITKNNFGHGGFGLFTIYSDYKIENTIEYIDSNTIKIYFVEKFSGIPTVVKVGDKHYSVQYSQEDDPINIYLKI